MAIFNSYVSLPEGIGDDQKSRNWEILFANQLQYRDDTGFWTLFNSGFLEWNGEAGYVLAILALYVCRGLWMSRKSARLSFRKPALNGHLHGKIIELNSRFSKDMCHHPEGNPDFFSQTYPATQMVGGKNQPGGFCVRTEVSLYDIPSGNLL